MNLISYWIQLNRRNTTIINLVIYEHEFFFFFFVLKFFKIHKSYCIKAPNSSK